MDVKNILNKIDECKIITQKKELLNYLKSQIANPKNKKVYEQLLKLNYEKTLNKMYTNKEFDIFLEIVMSIIQHLSPLSETYRKKYQKIILDLIIPKNLVFEKDIINNFDYFLIATNNLEDIENIKHKKYLVYYLFFNILLNIKLDVKIIDLFLKLDKYITKYQYDIILYTFIIYSLAKKDDDFGEQMMVLRKITEFCKFDFSNKNNIYSKNIDLVKNIFIMLLLYTPFRQEILINIYNIDQNYFMNIIQDIIISLNNNKQEDRNTIFNLCKNDLLNINDFFHEEIYSIDFDCINSPNDIIYNYFNDKEYLIKKYNKFISNMKLKNIFANDRIDIYKGIIWTLSSIILKNYYDVNSGNNDINNINIFEENKNHSIRLLKSLLSIFEYTNNKEQKNFIKQYLELVKSLIKEVNNFEEWSYILDILKKCCRLIVVKTQKKESIEKEFKKEINILNEIFSLILDCYNKKELIFCDIAYLSSILHNFNQFLKNDLLLCFYIDTYLTSEHKNKKYNIKSNFCKDNVYINFINNLEVLFYNIFSLSPKLFSKTKNYLLEIIRVNYLHDSKNEIEKNKDNNISKKIIIEKVLENYLENVFLSSGDNEQNYSFFNYTLMEILCKTRNLNFINRILTLLIFNNNEKKNNTLYSSFVSSTIINLFQNLMTNSSKCIFVKEKLSFLIDFFFGELNMNDENLLKFGLSVVKYFAINEQYEIIFDKNLNYLGDNNMNNNSLLVIDYLYYEIVSQKLTFQNEKEFIEFHKNYYAPYIVFPHIKLFRIINQNLENYITKTHILESVLELYYLCFSNNILFLKNVNLNLFFRNIFDEKELIKISYSKKITNLIFKILTCLPYQLNNDINFNSSSENIELTLKNISLLNDDMQLNVDSKYKISVINFLINFWSSLNIMISKTLRKIVSNEQLNQTIFNNHKETSNVNYEDKNIIMTIYNLMSRGDSHPWCGELNLYAQFDYLYDCINLLKFYLNSYSNEFIQSDINNIQSDKQDQNIAKNKKIFPSLKNIIQKIIVEIFNSLIFKYFNKKYTYYIISLLYEIKEILLQFISEDITIEIKAPPKKSSSYSNVKSQFNKIIDLNENKLTEKEMKGINIIYKAIFISLFLSWNCENKIIDSFDQILGTKYKSRILYKEKLIILKKFYDQKKNYDEGLQNLTQHMGDIFNLYLMQFIPEKNTSNLIDIIDEVFTEHKTYREYYFYKMAEWCLKIRKSREGININYKNIFDMNFLNNINNNYVADEYIGQKVLKNAYVFYGNNSLIIINPISGNKISFSLRNPICNMNLIFDSDVPIINNIGINNIDNDESISNEEEEEDDDNENKETSQKDNEENNISLSSDSNDSKNKEDYFPTNEKDKTKIFEFEEGTDEKIVRKRKISEDFSNMNFDLNNKNENRIKPKEFEDKINNRNNNNNIYPIRRKRFNTDLGDKYKKSMILAEKKKMMKNCLKLFSILTELTDFKIEQYKWFDIVKKNNLYNITKLIQNLDMIPLYFIHNCAIIYHPEKNKDTSADHIATYMNFIQKLGILFNYNDLYPDYNYNKKNHNNNNVINADFEKYIIINQDSFTRINFNILKLTEKDENKLIEENNIIFYWKNDNFDDSETDTEHYLKEKNIKIFFIITRITEKLYKIQRKYNTKKKEIIHYLIDELFYNEFIIDIENQSTIQLLINLIKRIDIIIKTYSKKETNKAKNKNIPLDNQNNINTDDEMHNFEEEINNFNYVNEDELMKDNDSPMMKRFKLMSKI